MIIQQHLHHHNGGISCSQNLQFRHWFMVRVTTRKIVTMSAKKLHMFVLHCFSPSTTSFLPGKKTFTLIRQCSPSKPACPGWKISVNCTSFSERTTCQMSLGTINKQWSYSLCRYCPPLSKGVCTYCTAAVVKKHEFLAASPDMLPGETMRVLTFRSRCLCTLISTKHLSGFRTLIAKRNSDS